jgi:hypothetical protein
MIIECYKTKFKLRKFKAQRKLSLTSSWLTLRSIVYLFTNNFARNCKAAVTAHSEIYQQGAQLRQNAVKISTLQKQDELSTKKHDHSYTHQSNSRGVLI